MVNIFLRIRIPSPTNVVARIAIAVAFVPGAGVSLIGAHAPVSREEILI